MQNEIRTFVHEHPFMMLKAFREPSGQLWIDGEALAHILGFEDPEKAVIEHCTSHRNVDINGRTRYFVKMNDFFNIVSYSRVSQGTQDKILRWLQYHIEPIMREIEP